ncbi:hypothetical protein HW130_01575 [Streptomyces sp. PKU-EA00015]|uniref:hypothetical protein n=1 Tax=Streptomyces sp. PKU-EA00015 TaxID=2748326 RepID=UPI0015A188A2|nr:hypothetical protein [Streptomyces sp. PKU-EA00015]NWF24960.1 hypothetical protein [Streptomyces sp. PKU-EA00015]
MAEYPHLGWDPAPGSPAEIAALQKKLQTSATALGTAHALVNRLLGESAHWRGEAAQAFRGALDGDLPRYLRNAHRSVSKASARLLSWHEDLVGYQATARTYETRARLSSAELRRAESHHDALAASPDAPPPDLRTAASAVTRARTALASVRALAHELEATHAAEAARIAKSLNEATDRLAPREPGALDKVLGWVDDHLGDTLALLSAGLGLAAILASGPLAVPLLFAAAGLSLAAFASHANDPRHRAALKAGFTDGRFDGKFWSSAVTLTADALGAVPGVGAVAQGAKGMTAATRAGIAAEHGAAATLRSGTSALRSDSIAAMREINDAPKPVLDWVVRRTDPRVQKPLEVGVAGAGVATSTVSLTPADSNDSAKNAATAVDGTRLAVSDGPGAGMTAARTWAGLAR